MLKVSLIPAVSNCRLELACNYMWKPYGERGVIHSIMKEAVALTLASGALFLAGCCTTRHVTQWEYKNLEVIGTAPDQNPQLNELGKEGWTVVAFQYVPGDSTHNTDYIYLLKRKLK